jgi:inosose dehydratase
MAELLDRVADRARAAGLIPSYHPHLGSLAETPEQIDALFERSAIGLCADVAHLEAGGARPAEVLRQYADRLAYVHLKDVELATGRFLPLGEGDVDLAAVITEIRHAGYRDWITVELDGYTGDLDAAAAQSRAYLGQQPLAD